VSTEKNNTGSVLTEIDLYLKKHGKPITRDNRARAAQGVAKWRNGWKDAMAEETKKSQAANRAAKANSSDVADDEAIGYAFIEQANREIDQRNAQRTSGAYEQPLVLGQNISIASAIEQGKLWWAGVEQDHDDKVTAAGRTLIEMEKAAHAHANRVMHQRDENDPIYLKYKHLLTPLTEEQAREINLLLVKDVVKGPREYKETIARCQFVAAEALCTTVLPEEWDRVYRWIQTFELDPWAEENWSNGFLVLRDHGIIRRTLPPMPKIEAPQKPKADSRRQVAREKLPQGRAQEQMQREADMLADIKAVFGDVVEDISSHDSVPVEDAVLVEAYSELMKARAELTRENIRKAIFYAILKVRGQRPAHSAFTNEEVDGFVYAAEAGKISAEETKRQLEKYGDVSTARVPDKTQALLQELVGKLGRKS